MNKLVKRVVSIINVFRILFNVFIKLYYYEVFSACCFVRICEARCLLSSHLSSVDFRVVFPTGDGLAVSYVVKLPPRERSQLTLSRRDKAEAKLRLARRCVLAAFNNVMIGRWVHQYEEEMKKNIIKYKKSLFGGINEMKEVFCCQTVNISE